MALPFLTCCAPAGLPNTPWPWQSCPPVVFLGITEKCGEGAALIVYSVGGCSSAALQLSHPRMISVADLHLEIGSYWRRSETVWERRQREEAAVTAEGAEEEDGFSFWWARSHEHEVTGHEQATHTLKQS